MQSLGYAQKRKFFVCRTRINRRIDHYRDVDPQIITGSYDSTIKTWDLAAGKCMDVDILKRGSRDVYASSTGSLVPLRQITSRSLVCQMVSSSITCYLSKTPSSTPWLNGGVMISGGDTVACAFGITKPDIASNRYKRRFNRVHGPNSIFALGFDKTGEIDFLRSGQNDKDVETRPVASLLVPSEHSFRSTKSIGRS